MDIYKTGVYKITSLLSGKFYIGSTGKLHKQKSLCGFYRRFEHHKQALRKGKHCNRHLQHAWNKYGEENFTFEILAKCPPEYCIKFEQFFTDTLKPEYNIRKIAESNLGITQTEEHKRKRGQSFSQNYYSNPNRRENNSRVKLTAEQIIDIKLMLKEGRSLRYCGNIYNVYASTIQNIKSGRTWKDIVI